MIYSLLRLLFLLIFKVLFRWEVSGAENIPKSGGTIIASNHISLWDPPVIGTAMQRQIHFMAKEELFKIPVFNSVIRKLNAFPVKRGAVDRNALKTALNILKEGKVLGIFPEGTRSKDGKLGHAQPGATLLALKAGVPVVPTAVVGTNKFFSGKALLPKFKVKFGTPLIPDENRSDKEYAARFSDKLMTEIAKLLDEK